MIILDIPRKVPVGARFIEIPAYHRGHLSLAQNRPVYLCLLPSRPPFSDPATPPVPELILSAFEFSRWHQLWRLTLTLRDRVGLVHDVFAVLASQNVDVLAAETCTFRERGLHTVEVVIGAHNESTLPVVEWALCAHLIEDIAFDAEGNPRLRIRRVHNLLDAKRAFDELATRPAHHYDDDKLVPLQDCATLEEFAPPGEGPRRLRVRLPQRIRDALKRTVAETREGHKSLDWGYYLRVSDTKDRLLRVLFFRGSEPVIHARIEHNNQLGAVSSIARALSKGGFNIISALATPTLAGNAGKAWLEVVVRRTKGAPVDAATLKQEIESALRADDCGRGLALTVAYPRSYTEEASPARELGSPAAEVDDGPEEGSVEPLEPGKLARRIGLRQEALAHEMEAGWHPEKKNTYVLLGRLSRQYEEFSARPQAKTMFVSCRFIPGELDAILRAAKKRGILVYTGQNLEGFQTQVEGVITKMRACTHFLGVWSLDGALRAGRQNWPSPWLLWELGAAEAFGLELLLLISEGIWEPSWKKIYGYRQQVTYKEGEFEKQLEHALDVLIGAPHPAAK